MPCVVKVYCSSTEKPRPTLRVQPRQSKNFMASRGSKCGRESVKLSRRERYPLLTPYIAIESLGVVLSRAVIAFRRSQHMFISHRMHFPSLQDLKVGGIEHVVTAIESGLRARKIMAQV